MAAYLTKTPTKLHIKAISNTKIYGILNYHIR
jgi:hypothetical protein